MHCLTLACCHFFDALFNFGCTAFDWHLVTKKALVNMLKKHRPVKQVYALHMNSNFWIRFGNIV